MVCSLGSSRMAVMARLLEAGSISPSIAGFGLSFLHFPLYLEISWSEDIQDVVNQKLAAQYIYRELRGADEANLLDEEDIHVFGLKPTTDPLHLVCCIACKKPVKASQYVAHAELCRSLKITEEIILELDGSTGHRKPPRKERKKSLAAYANQPTLVRDQERSEIIDDDDETTASESLMDEQIGMSSTLTMRAKRKWILLISLAFPTILTGIPLVQIHFFCSTVSKPGDDRSRYMLYLWIAGDCLPILDDPKTASGMKKILNSHDVYTSKDFPIGTVSESEIPTEALENCQLTKMSQQSTMTLRDSSQGVSPLEQLDNLLTEKQECSQQISNQNLAQISELCSSKSKRYLLSNDFLNPQPLDNIPRPQADSVGLTRRKYVPEHGAFSGNSGSL
ncbi:Tubby-like F-box protein 3 isoform 1 [Hibiscus syriacus]|uniref:Tubby-like F-box protein 3 isoform 1 n=1 Tax=Hibiscus syriacus TaxID=106335 RepID=A0A6A3CY00_HIBSY|nr:Tubby-like F-box protein 3 isoform 1 [Hibiscus syriacus]